MVKTNVHDALKTLNDKFHTYQTELNVNSQVQEDTTAVPAGIIKSIVADAKEAVEVLKGVSNLKIYYDQFLLWKPGPEHILENYPEESGMITISNTNFKQLTTEVLDQMANLVHDAAGVSIKATGTLKACKVQSFGKDDTLPLSMWCSGVIGQSPIVTLLHEKDPKTDKIITQKEFTVDGKKYIQTYSTNLEQSLGQHKVSPSFNTVDLGGGPENKMAIEYHDSDSTWEPGSTNRLKAVKQRLELMGFDCNVGKKQNIPVGLGGSHVIYCNIPNIQPLERIRELATFFSLLYNGDTMGNTAVGADLTPLIREKIWDIAQKYNQQYGDNIWKSHLHNFPGVSDWAAIYNEWKEEQKKKTPLYNEIRELMVLHDKHHMIENQAKIPSEFGSHAATITAMKELLLVWEGIQKLYKKVGTGNISSAISTLKGFIASGHPANITSMSDGVAHNLHAYLAQTLAHAGKYGNCSTSGPIANINAGNLAYCEGVLEGTTATAPSNNRWLHAADPNMFDVGQGEEFWAGGEYDFTINTPGGNPQWQKEIANYLKTQGFECSEKSCKKGTESLDFIRQMALFLSNLRGANEQVGIECAKKAVADAAKAAEEQTQKGIFAFTQEPIMPSKKAWIDKCWKQYNIMPPKMTPEEKLILGIIGPNKLYGGCRFDKSDILPDLGVLKYCEGVRLNAQNNAQLPANATFMDDGLRHFYHQEMDEIAKLNIIQDPKSKLYGVKITGLNMTGQHPNSSHPLQKVVKSRLKEHWHLMCPSPTECLTQVPLDDDQIRFLAAYLSSFHKAWEVDPSCTKAAEQFAFSDAESLPHNLEAHQSQTKVHTLEEWTKMVCSQIPGGVKVPEPEVGKKPPEPVKPEPEDVEYQIIKPPLIHKLHKKGKPPFEVGGCVSLVAEVPTLAKAAYCAGVRNTYQTPTALVHYQPAKLYNLVGQHSIDGMGTVTFDSEGKTLLITLPDNLMLPGVTSFLTDKLKFSQKEKVFSRKLGSISIPSAAIFLSQLNNLDKVPDDCKEKAIANAMAEASKLEYQKPIFPFTEEDWGKFCTSKATATPEELDSYILSFFEAIPPSTEWTWEEVKDLITKANPNVNLPPLFHSHMNKLVKQGKLTLTKGLYSLPKPTVEPKPIKPVPTHDGLKIIIYETIKALPEKKTDWDTLEKLIKENYEVASGPTGTPGTIVGALDELVHEGTLIFYGGTTYGLPEKKIAKELIQAKDIIKDKAEGLNSDILQLHEEGNDIPTIAILLSTKFDIELNPDLGKYVSDIISQAKKVEEKLHPVSLEELKSFILNHVILEPLGSYPFTFIQDKVSAEYKLDPSDIQDALDSLVASGNIAKEPDDHYELPPKKEKTLGEVIEAHVIDKLIATAQKKLVIYNDTMTAADWAKFSEYTEYKKLPKKYKDYFHDLSNWHILKAYKDNQTYDQVIKDLQGTFLKQLGLHLSPLMIKLQTDLELKAKKNKGEIPADWGCGKAEKTCVLPAKKYENLTKEEQEEVKDSVKVTLKAFPNALKAFPKQVLLEAYESVKQKWGLEDSIALNDMVIALPSEIAQETSMLVWETMTEDQKANVLKIAGIGIEQKVSPDEVYKKLVMGEAFNPIAPSEDMKLDIEAIAMQAVNDDIDMAFEQLAKPPKHSLAYFNTLYNAVELKFPWLKTYPGWDEHFQKKWDELHPSVIGSATWNEMDLDVKYALAKKVADLQAEGSTGIISLSIKEAYPALDLTTLPTISELIEYAKTHGEKPVTEEEKSLAAIETIFKNNPTKWLLIEEIPKYLQSEGYVQPPFEDIKTQLLKLAEEGTLIQTESGTGDALFAMHLFDNMSDEDKDTVFASMEDILQAAITHKEPVSFEEAWQDIEDNLPVVKTNTDLKQWASDKWAEIQKEATEEEKAKPPVEVIEVGPPPPMVELPGLGEISDQAYEDLKEFILQLYKEHKSTEDIYESISTHEPWMFMHGPYKVWENIIKNVIEQAGQSVEAIPEASISGAAEPAIIYLKAIAKTKIELGSEPWEVVKYLSDTYHLAVDDALMQLVLDVIQDHQEPEEEEVKPPKYYDDLSQEKKNEVNDEISKLVEKGEGDEYVIISNIEEDFGLEDSSALAEQVEHEIELQGKELISWGDLSEDEQLSFAKKVMAFGIKGWEQLKAMAQESGIYPSMDELPTILELNIMAKQSEAEEPPAPDQVIEQETMAKFIKQGMSAQAVTELFGSSSKAKSTSNKLYNLYHPDVEVMTKPLTSMPTWVQGHLTNIANQMLNKGKTVEDTIWYIAYNYHLNEADVAQMVKKESAKPVTQQKQLIETTIKILGVGEKLAGCKIADEGLTNVTPSTVAYCQGAIAPSGEEANAKTEKEGKQLLHSTPSQYVTLDSDTEENKWRTDLTYFTAIEKNWKERLFGIEQVLADLGFLCDKGGIPGTKICEKKGTDGMSMSINDQDLIRRTALFLSSIDKVNELDVMCIPKAIAYAKEHARALNKTSKPWTTWVYPSTVEEWNAKVCELI